MQHGGACGSARRGARAEGTHFYDLDHPDDGLRYEGAWAQGRQHGCGALTVDDFSVRSVWNDGSNDQVRMQRSLAAVPTGWEGKMRAERKAAPRRWT